MPPEINLTLPAATPAPTTPAATPTPAAPANGFTREPIAVTPAVETPAVVKEPETAKVPDDSPLVRELAKANKEARDLRKANEAFSTQLAELNTKLAGATEGSTKAAQLEAEIADMLAKPAKYMAKFKAKGANKLAEILEGFAADEIPEDPRLTEIEKKLKERDERDAQEKEEREKQSMTANEQRAAEENKRVNGEIVGIMASDKNVEDADGVQRWALVSTDDGAPERARLAVLEFAIKEGVINVLTREMRDDLLMQALDQMEFESRAEALKKAERLKLAKKTPTGLTDPGRSFTVAPRPNQDSASQRKAPVIDPNVRGSLPAPSAERVYVHGWTTKS